MSAGCCGTASFKKNRRKKTSNPSGGTSGNEVKHQDPPRPSISWEKTKEGEKSTIRKPLTKCKTSSSAFVNLKRHPADPSNLGLEKKGSSKKKGENYRENYEQNRLPGHQGMKKSHTNPTQTVNPDYTRWMVQLRKLTLRKHVHEIHKPNLDNMVRAGTGKEGENTPQWGRGIKKKSLGRGGEQVKWPTGKSNGAPGKEKRETTPARWVPKPGEGGGQQDESRNHRHGHPQ